MAVMLNRRTAGARRETGRRPPTGIPRTVELVVALLALLAASPLLALSAVAVALSSRGPVLFRQKRVGLGARQFTLYKLRTMRVGGGPAPQVTAGDDSRITPVGRVLRKTKLDELPELWNVVKGDMSLVGPRPEVPRYVNPEDALWRRVLQARPGLTDPVTLLLRNEESLMARVVGDRERFYVEWLLPFKLRGYLSYFDCRTCATDLRVLWRTAVAVVVPSEAPPPSVDEIVGGARAGLR